MNANTNKTQTQQDLEELTRLLQVEGVKISEHLKNPLFVGLIQSSLQLLLVTCHSAARQAGWWNDPKTGTSVTDNSLCFGNKLLLIHSEVSEAMEGDRKSLPDDKLPHHEMRTVELGDALIRILDTAGGFDLKLAQATVEKLIFNTVRPDHKHHHRIAEGGKAY